MKAWRHAERSIAAIGGPYEEHLAMHAFMDRTKDAYAQVGHRFLLHNSDLAPQVMARRFMGGPDVRDLVRHHLEDDLGRDAVPLADWLLEMRQELLPRVKPGPLAGMTTDEQGDALARRFSLADPTLPRAVASLLALDQIHCPGVPAWAKRLAMRHSMGPWLAEAHLGVVLEVEKTDGTLGVIGVREIAEVAIAGEIGGIPPYAGIARSIRLQPWMAGAQEI